MLSLACSPVIEHVVKRTEAATTVDEIVVATTSHQRDDIVKRYAEEAGATVFRGDEDDVLGRLHQAAELAEADIIVRVTGDCPLISPECVDAVVDSLVESKADYASNVVERTFPRGLDVEAFTYESFSNVESLADRSRHREHVTTYYLEHTEAFDVRNVSSFEVFEADDLHGRTDIRLTLDEADDYELLRTVFEASSPDTLLSFPEAIHYIDEHNLRQMNSHVEQEH